VLKEHHPKLYKSAWNSNNYNRATNKQGIFGSVQEATFCCDSVIWFVFFGESSRPSFFVLVGHNFLISNPFSLTTVSMSDVLRGGVQTEEVTLASWMCVRLASWITTHPSGKKRKFHPFSSKHMLIAHKAIAC
jgi:hypothetical protein